MRFSQGQIPRYLLAGCLLGMGYGLSSCEKVITMDLNSSLSKLVIEGNINNLPGPYTVKLSRTTNYFEPVTSPPESGAFVALTDNAGNLDTLHEGIPGVYSSSHITGEKDRTYSLLVRSQGQVYTASQTIPDTVGIDSLNYRLGEDFQTHLQRYTIICSFTDPPGAVNYYGFRLYRNGGLKINIVENRVISDLLSNGKDIHVRFGADDFAANDTIRIELVAFGKEAYVFYNSMQQTLESGSPFSSPPANPVTDLSNGGLGFFGAFAITSKTIILR